MCLNSCLTQIMSLWQIASIMSRYFPVVFNPLWSPTRLQHYNHSEKVLYVSLWVILFPYSQLFHWWRAWSCFVDQRPALFAAMSSALRVSTQKWKGSFLRLDYVFFPHKLSGDICHSYRLTCSHFFLSCCNRTSAVRRFLQRNKTQNLAVQTSTFCTFEEKPDYRTQIVTLKLATVYWACLRY